MKNKLWKKIGLPFLAVILLMLGVDNLSELGLGETLDDSLNSELVNGETEESYNTLQEVVDYLHLHDELPSNYLTKKEARDLGWEASEGNLWDVAPNASIGGDHFGNFEGLLPDEPGRDYQEADINYEGGYRGGERLVFSNDGLYFYTEDHYQSFNEVEPAGEEQ